MKFVLRNQVFETKNERFVSMSVISIRDLFPEVNH